MGISYSRADVTTSKRASEALRELGKNPFGMTNRMGVPTTLVGRKVIRGADVEGIRKALAEARRR